jgi:hypothetical protein
MLKLLGAEDDVDGTSSAPLMGTMGRSGSGFGVLKDAVAEEDVDGREASVWIVGGWRLDSGSAPTDSNSGISSKESDRFEDDIV